MAHTVLRAPALAGGSALADNTRAKLFVSTQRGAGVYWFRKDFWCKGGKAEFYTGSRAQRRWREGKSRHSWRGERNHPTVLRPPPATTSYHTKVTCVSMLVIE
jgi:hypothetical protein